MTSANPLPPQAELRRVFDYNPNTGDLCWRISPTSRVIAGDSAARRSPNGYLRVNWCGKTIKVHRLAWKYMTGVDPVTVDHLNRNAEDNRWENLRDATQLDQNRNRYIRKNTEADIRTKLEDAIAQAKLTRKTTRSAPLPSREELMHLFRYDPDTGYLWYLKDGRNRKRMAGTFVQTQVKGYLKTYVAGREPYVHRIAWKIMTGEDALLVDHINKNTLDNRWVNLRSVESYQNQGNRKLSPYNRSGSTGVYWAADKNKWTAQISVGDKIVYLGRYGDIEDAKKAYETAAAIHFHLTEKQTGACVCQA